MITAEQARAALDSNADRLGTIAAEKKSVERWIRRALGEGKETFCFCWNGVDSPVIDKEYDINAEMVEWLTSLGYRVTPTYRFATLHYDVEW